MFGSVVRNLFIAVCGMALLVACSSPPNDSLKSKGASVATTLPSPTPSTTPTVSMEAQFTKVMTDFNSVLSTSGARFVGNAVTTDFIDTGSGSGPDQFLAAMATDHIKYLQFLGGWPTWDSGFCQYLMIAQEGRAVIDKYVSTKLPSPNDLRGSSLDAVASIQSDWNALSEAIEALDWWCGSTDRAACKASAGGLLPMEWPSVNSLIYAAGGKSLPGELKKIYNKQFKKSKKYLPDFPCDPDPADLDGFRDWGLSPIFCSDAPQGSWLLLNLAPGVADERARFVLEAYRGDLEFRNIYIATLICR